MKFLSIIVILCLSISTTLLSQTTEVPAVVQEYFATEYANAKNVEWTIESEYLFEVSFTLDNTAYEVLYGEKGIWQRIEHEIDLNGLPTAILSSINNRWSSDEIEEISLIEIHDGTIQFEVVVGGFELLYSPDGELLKKEDADEDDNQPVYGFLR